MTVLDFVVFSPNPYPEQDRPPADAQKSPNFIVKFDNQY